MGFNSGFKGLSATENTVKINFW